MFSGDRTSSSVITATSCFRPVHDPRRSLADLLATLVGVWIPSVPLRGDLLCTLRLLQLLSSSSGKSCSQLTYSNSALRPLLTSLPTSLGLSASVASSGTDKDLLRYHTCASRPTCWIYADSLRIDMRLTDCCLLSQSRRLTSNFCSSG